MKRLMLLVAMLAMVVVVASVAAPAMAQDPKAERKAARQAAKAEKAAAKATQQPSAKMKEMPKTGGVPVNTALLGLGASAVLVGSGLLVRRVTR